MYQNALIFQGDSRKIDALLSRLEQVSPIGENRWKARCPAHEDRNPSLSITLGNDGKILLKCFADCNTEAVVAAIGLTMRDLFPNADSRNWQPHKSNQRVASAKPKSPAAASASKPASSPPPPAPKVYSKTGCLMRTLTYHYPDGMAEPYVRIIRREYSGINPKSGKAFKTFEQQRWCPQKKRYTVGSGVMTGVLYVPFDAPSFKEATNIFWCEGEKKCAMLSAAIAASKPEIVVSTRWGGSSSPLQPELINWFRSKHVVIFADADDAGKQYAQNTARAIKHVAASVRIVASESFHDVEDLILVLQARRQA